MSKKDDGFVLTTVVMPNYIRERLFMKVGERLIAGEIGKGKHEEPSTNQILIEDIAKALGVEIESPSKNWVRPAAHEDILFLLRMPKAVHVALLENKKRTGKSLVNTIMEIEENAMRDDREPGKRVKK